MNAGPTTLNYVTLGIALWGALLSTYLALAKRRRRIVVHGDWGTAPRGDDKRHLYFVVKVSSRLVGEVGGISPGLIAA